MLVILGSCVSEMIICYRVVNSITFLSIGTIMVFEVFLVLLLSSLMFATLFGLDGSGGGVITLPVFPLGLKSELEDFTVA